MVFFENTLCGSCGHPLAYDPARRTMRALLPAGGDVNGGDANAAGPADAAVTSADADLADPTQRLTAEDPAEPVRLCANMTAYDVCNWLVVDEGETLCRSCRLTRTLPDLSVPGNPAAWNALEQAKRRLVYTLDMLRLPMPNRIDDAEEGLAFDFMQGSVLTGHASGVITVNIAEADPAERERRRVVLNEDYRTLLGHLRHESGHYYWDRLVRDSDRLDAFRDLFGDEREDYDAALARYRAEGPPPAWNTSHISAYATSHPWEDWAESWSHYLAMIDLIETATSSGIADPLVDLAMPVPQAPGTERFATMLRMWIPVTVVVNNLNRSLGQGDAYPFAPPAPAIGKLAFIDSLLSGDR